MAEGKEKRLVAKDRDVEESGGLFGQGDEEVRQGYNRRQSEGEEDEDYGSRHGAHVSVVQWEADGDVTLQGHACQDEGGGASSQHGCHHLERRGGRRRRDRW